MTKSNRRSTRVAARQGVFPLFFSGKISEEEMAELVEDIVLAVMASGRKAMGSDTIELLGYNDLEFNTKLQAESEMRSRINKALCMNINFDSIHNGWEGFDKKLVKIETETNQTIELFMLWFRDDGFRAKQDVYLTAEKILKFWPKAFGLYETKPETPSRTMDENGMIIDAS